MEVNSERIAEIIRKVDGNHSMGAGALADAIMAELEKDRELSDLEIVQKALDQSKLVDHRCASLDFDSDGNWIVWQYSESAAHQFASGNGSESLLTWAKQQIGVE